LSADHGRDARSQDYCHCGGAKPALFGFTHIKLLIPSRLAETLSPMEWRHIFMHELAHIRRRDVGLNWLMVMLHALHWFNPVIWLAFKRMCADANWPATPRLYPMPDRTKPGLMDSPLLNCWKAVQTGRHSRIGGDTGRQESNQTKDPYDRTIQAMPTRPLVAGLLLTVLCMIAMTDAQTRILPIQPSGKRRHRAKREQTQTLCQQLPTKAPRTSRYRTQKGGEE